MYVCIIIVRLTPPSQPNKAGLDVRPYICPQKVLPICMKFSVSVEVNE